MRGKRQTGNYSSVSVSEVNLRTKGLEKDPVEEGSANLNAQGLASISKAKERGAARAKAQQGEGIWFGGIWKKFNTAQVVSMSGAKIRPQR